MAEKRSKVKDFSQFQLRLPDEMRDAIRLAAEANDRSMNAEIIARLEYSFDVKTITKQTVLDEAVKVVQQAAKDMNHNAEVLRWMYEQQSVSMHLLELIAQTDGHLKPEFMDTLRGMLARRGSDSGFPELPDIDAIPKPASAD